uniref:MICOS complex subunit n=1 Tax=Cyprinus carpio TaxID=7962 RepID=A0A8C2C9J4_CYPCA
MHYGFMATDKDLPKRCIHRISKNLMLINLWPLQNQNMRFSDLHVNLDPYESHTFLGVYGTVKPKVDSTVQFGQNSYVYLKNPPPEFYPRAGVIGLAGILGLFLGRGSRLKKVIYPTGLMAVAASMYYPQEAVTIAKNTGDTVYDLALQAYVAVEKLIKDKPASKKDRAEKSSSGETKA